MPINNMPYYPNEVFTGGFGFLISLIAISILVLYVFLIIKLLPIILNFLVKIIPAFLDFILKLLPIILDLINSIVSFIQSHTKSRELKNAEMENKNSLDK